MAHHSEKVVALSAANLVIRELPLSEVQQMVDLARINFHSGIYDEVLAARWSLLSCGDGVGTPKVEVAHVADDTQASQGALDSFRQSVQVVSLLDYSAVELPPLRVVLDQSSGQYYDSLAFYTRSTNTIWVKQAKRSFSLPHELGHWATLWFFEAGTTPPPLLMEGLAAWINMQVCPPQSNNSVSRYRERTTIWRQVLSPESVNLDSEFYSVCAADLGGVLFDILAQQLGGGRQLGLAWRSSVSCRLVSEWLESLGMDPLEIEAEWKKAIFG